MDGYVTDDDVAAWLFAEESEGPEVAFCALAHATRPVCAPEEFGHRTECRFQFLSRTNGLVGHKSYPKPKRERKRRTPEEIRAARLARNARYRSKAETRAKFYAWRNEYRRKRRAAGVAYANVDRRQAS